MSGNVVKGKSGFQVKHGLSRLPEYAIWQNMVGRCHRINHQFYDDYGGRGIEVCERWRTSFVDFLADVGRRPCADLTLERPDNNGNYEPGNVTWATRKEQGRNKRNNRLLTFHGKTLCIAEWSEITGISRDAIKQRLRLLGWSVERALTAKVLKRGGRPRKAATA